MKSFINNFFYIIIVNILLLIPITAFANAEDYTTLADAQSYCGKWHDIATCTQHGCNANAWRTSSDNPICVAFQCDNQPASFCDNHKYCKWNSVTNPGAHCSTRRTCEDLKLFNTGCYPYDDNNNPCEVDPNRCGEDSGRIDYPDGSTSYRNTCLNFYTVGSGYINATPELRRAYCEVMNPASVESCIASIPLAQMTGTAAYTGMCARGNSCGVNQFSYVTVVGNNGSGYAGSKQYSCDCLPGYGFNSSRQCVKTGGGGGGTSCTPVDSYVDAYEQFDGKGNSANICTYDDACYYADCDLSAEPALKTDSSQYQTGVDNIKVDGRDTGKYGGAGLAWRYHGECNGKKTDVFCIDPGSKYHDMSANYTCSASMKEDSVIDQGYIKIYQLAVDEYEAFQKSQRLSDDEYQAMHFAFRFWTFYKSGRDTDGGEDEHLDYQSNLNISYGFKYTADRIAGKSSKNTYFMVKNSSSALVDGSVYGTDYQKQGYRDSVKFFKLTADNSEPIWTNPLKFTKHSQRDEKHVVIRLSGIQGLKDARFDNVNFLRNIYCKEASQGCKISVPKVSDNYINEGNDYIDISVDLSAFNGTTYTIGVDYYDRRDGKNVILATAGKPGEYQRLVYTTAAEISGSNVRTFHLEEPFNITSASCTINGNIYHDINGNICDRGTFVKDCCGTMNEDRTLYRNYCNTIRNTVHYQYQCNEQYEWLEHSCDYLCSADTNAPVTGDCYSEDVAINQNDQTVDIRIADLTNANDINGMSGKFVNSDGYCLSCAEEAEKKIQSIVGNNEKYVRHSNDYCTVYCVEEYKFTVPYELKVVTDNYGTSGSLAYGRYMKLKVPAAAKQVCTTDMNNEINYKKFKETQDERAVEIRKLISKLSALKAALYDLEQNGTDSLTLTKDTKTCSNPGHCEWDSSSDCPSYNPGYSVGGSSGSCSSSTVTGMSNCTCSYKQTGCSHTGYMGVKINDRDRTTSKGGKNDVGACSNDYTEYSYKVVYTSTESKTFSSGGSCDTSNCSVQSGDINSLKTAISNEIDSVFKDIEKKVKVYNDEFGIYESCYKNYSDYSSLSGSCFKDDNAPYIEFKYDEPYYMGLLGAMNRLVGEWSSTSTKLKYYSQTDRSSDNCTYTGAGTDSPTYGPKEFNNYSLNASSHTVTVSTNRSTFNSKYTYSSNEKTSTLEPQAVWYTTYGDGTASLIPRQNNSIKIGRVLPISRKSQENTSNCNETTHRYELQLKNVGLENGNSCKLGRLNRYLSYMNPETTNTNAEYRCIYKVSKNSCRGCETSYYYRSISLNDVFPKSGQGLVEAGYITDIKESIKPAKLANEREVSPVWSTERGQETQRNIEKLGEHTYDKENMEFSYTLTPAGMKQIRNYNKNTTYGDWNIKCNSNGVCTSEFLDKIKNNDFGSGVKQNKRDGKYERYTKNGKNEIWR